MTTLQLPRLPIRQGDFLHYLESHKGTYPRILLQPYLTYEARLREIFAQQPQHPALTDGLVNAVPIYEGAQDAMCIHARDFTRETFEQQSKYLMPLKSIDRKSHGSPAIVSSLQEFQSNFNIFSEASLSEMDWNNVVAAGSSVVTSLLPIPSRFAESKRTKREWYHDKFAPASDVDLFLYALTEEQAVAKIKQIERCVRDSVLQDTTTVRTKNAITIASVYPTRHIQIVLRMYKSISEILTGFDVDCSCAAYDGKQVYASPRAVVSFMTQTNEIDLSRRSPSYENRLQKYAKRCFEIHWDGLDRERIDPTIYERNFVRTVGLARLLVYEKLPQHTDRESYIDERRLERGRPAANNYFRHAHELPGNFKQHAIEEVNEAIQEDAVANYHTFSIPYGPKYNAKRVEKLLYTKDLLLNAEWNKPKDREVNLHRHPAFFGAVDDVVGDCCGFCPSPATEEDKKVAEEESKTFVSGKMRFLRDDPGRQAIGSFNPINDDEWTKMAYVGDTARLCSAITQDNLDFVMKWCSVQGNDVNERDYCGRTPLHLAAMVSTPRITQCLIDNGARLIARLVDGKTSLHLAAIRGGAVGLNTVRALLRRSEANEEEEANKQDVRRKARDKSQAVDGELLKSEGSDSTSDSGEDVEMRSDSKTPMQTMTEGSFVKIEGDEAKQKDLDMAQGEKMDDPDVYDVNVYSWDIQVSALHYAIILNHKAIVEELVQNFGADPMVPVKIVDSWNSRPRSAILTPVLVLHLPPAEAKQMLELLLKLGVTSSQADMDRHSALHRFVAACNAELIKALFDEDGPAAQKAINFFIADQTFGRAASGMIAPLMTAITSLDSLSLRVLVQAGANTSFTFRDCDFTDHQQRAWHALTKDTFHESIEQPIVTALRYENVDAVNILLERGVDVNTLTSEAHMLINEQENSGDNVYGPGFMVGETLLDVVRNKIEFLKAWNPLKCYTDEIVDIYEPEAMPAEDIVFAGVGPGTFKHNRLQAELCRGRTKREDEQKSFEWKIQDRAQNSGLGLKETAISRTIEELKTLENGLVSKGARSFNELYPQYIEKNEENKRDTTRSRPARHISYGGYKFGPWRFRPDLGFETGIKEDDFSYGRFERLFEGAWSGDLELVRSLTTNSRGDDNKQSPLEASTHSTDQFTPFTLSVIRGHLDCATVILEICAAQYNDPNSPEGKKKYSINTEAMSEESRDEDELDVDSEDEGEPLTTDVAVYGSQQVKSRISPEAALDSRMLVVRIREISPDKLPDDDSWNSGGNITVLQYAIATDNERLIDWILDLKLKYRRSQVAERDLFDKPIVTLTDYKMAMELGRIDILNKLIRRTGAGLSVGALAQSSGVQATEKPKYYQGLTVYGSKRKAWAQRGRLLGSDADQSAAPPLLHAAWSGSLKAVQWALGTEPERQYIQFAEANKHCKHIQALAKANGGFDGQLRKWLRTRGNSVLLLSVLARECGNGSHDNVDALQYIGSNFRTLLETKSTTRGYTPLMLAFAFCDVEAVRILIQEGANQMCRDSEGNNLLHVLTSHLPNDSRNITIPDQLRREMLDMLDPRVVSSMFLERSASEKDQSFLTPLARFVKKRSTWYVGVDQAKRHKVNRWDERQVDSPEHYPGDGERDQMKHDMETLQLFLDKSPQNKDLDALDGAGDTVAHLTARCRMFPLFQEIIERRPSLLFRENAVGRTPLEIARDIWLEEHIKEQPEIGPAARLPRGRDLAAASISVATRKPEYFIALKRYEERKRKGDRLSPELSTFAERTYGFALEVAGREANQAMPRRLVSLNEANIVAERLARRERRASGHVRGRGPRSSGRGKGENEGRRGTSVDEVEEWGTLS